LIVGDNNDLADLENEKTIDRVVSLDRQPQYITFGQFKPRPGSPWSLQQMLLKTDEEKVEVKIAKKAPDLKIEIHRKVLEARPDLAAVLVVNCRSKGWGASERSEERRVGKECRAGGRTELLKEQMRIYRNSVH